jgi:hypothetical protein
MFKIIKFLGVDRIAHFGIGCFITTMCIFLLSWLGLYTVAINGILLPLVLALYKEEKDKSLGGKFDKWDVIATMTGSLFTLGMFFFVLFAGSIF